jgi:nucleoside-diphosphate-sugar epimerase
VTTTLQTVFVTGATGFIGTHLVERLAERGTEVRCLVRPSSPAAGAAHLRRPGVVRMTGSLADPASYRDGLRGCDAVLHLGGLVAAPRVADLHAANAAGTAMLADACADLPSPPRLLCVSSVAAAGPPPPGRACRDETDEPMPISDYGLSKRAGEIELQRRADRLPVTVVAPGIVYGPGDPKTATLFKAIHRMRVHVTVGVRTPPLSLIHAADLVDLVIAAAERGETLAHDGDGRYSPAGYYLACDDRVYPDYGQFGRHIARALGRSVLVVPLPVACGRLVGLVAQTVARPDPRGNILSLDKVREATVRSWACSAAKARSQLGFRPAASLEARLRETAEAFADAGWL